MSILGKHSAARGGVRVDTWDDHEPPKSHVTAFKALMDIRSALVLNAV